MNIKKIKLIILQLAILLSLVVPTRVSATIPVIDGAHIGSTILNIFENAGSFIETALIYVWENAAKPAALAVVKEKMISMVNDNILQGFMTGNDGDPFFVTNWQEHLYKDPQDKATEYIIDDFIVNKLSGGNCGGTVNPYYDYLCEEAEDSIETIQVVTTLPDYYDPGVDPRDDLFASGDLRGFDAYFQCGNNPYCTTTKTKELHEQVAAQNKEVAEKQSSGEGMLSSLNDDGTVKTPGFLIADSVNDTLLMGNGVLVNATTIAEVVVGIFSSMLSTRLSDGFNADSGAVPIDFTRYGL